MAIRKTNKGTDDGIKMEVIEKCGVISSNDRGWQTELRFVSWNGNDPKYDIRSWKEDENGEKCGKGITLTGEELEQLGNIINELKGE